MRFFRNEKGFTLIELMVVILIIGILVAIAVPIFNNARASAQRRTCQANLRTLDGAVQTWKADHPDTVYPNSPATLAADLVPEYIKSMPTCPSDGQAYGCAGPGTQTGSPTISCPNTALGHSYP